jgi:hypothetical protein
MAKTCCLLASYLPEVDVVILKCRENDNIKMNITEAKF